MRIKYIEFVQVNQNVFIKTRKSESSNVNEIDLINRTVFRLLTLFGVRARRFEQKETKTTKGRPASSFPSLSSVDSRDGSTDGHGFHFECFAVTFPTRTRRGIAGRRCESGDPPRQCSQPGSLNPGVTLGSDGTVKLLNTRKHRHREQATRG